MLLAHMLKWVELREKFKKQQSKSKVSEDDLDENAPFKEWERIER